jgi:hypothetical protein
VPPSIQLRAFGRTERSRLRAERLTKDTNEVAVGAIADAARDRGDLHARSNLGCGTEQPDASGIAADGIAGFEQESRAEVTPTATRNAGDLRQWKRLGEMARDVALGAIHDRREVWPARSPIRSIDCRMPAWKSRALSVRSKRADKLGVFYACVYRRACRRNLFHRRLTPARSIPFVEGEPATSIARQVRAMINALSGRIGVFISHCPAPGTAQRSADSREPASNLGGLRSTQLDSSGGIKSQLRVIGSASG